MVRRSLPLLVSIGFLGTWSRLSAPRAASSMLVIPIAFDPPFTDCRFLRRFFASSMESFAIAVCRTVVVPESSWQHIVVVDSLSPLSRCRSTVLAAV